MSIGEYPSDAILPNQKLPLNSVVLKMWHPAAPAIGSKYILFYYGKSGYTTRRGSAVFLPVYILVREGQSMPLNTEEDICKTLRVFKPQNGAWIYPKQEIVRV